MTTTKCDTSGQDDRLKPSPDGVPQETNLRNAMYCIGLIRQVAKHHPPKSREDPMPRIAGLAAEGEAAIAFLLPPDALRKHGYTEAHAAAGRPVSLPEAPEAIPGDLHPINKAADSVRACLRKAAGHAADIDSAFCIEPSSENLNAEIDSVYQGVDELERVAMSHADQSAPNPSGDGEPPAKPHDAPDCIPAGERFRSLADHARGNLAELREEISEIRKQAKEGLVPAVEYIGRLAEAADENVRGLVDLALDPPSPHGVRNLQLRLITSRASSATDRLRKLKGKDMPPWLLNDLEAAVSELLDMVP